MVVFFNCILRALPIKSIYSGTGSVTVYRTFALVLSIQSKSTYCEGLVIKYAAFVLCNLSCKQSAFVSNERGKLSQS